MKNTKSVWQRFVAICMILLLVLSALTPLQAGHVQASETGPQIDARFWQDEPTVGFYIDSANKYLLETVKQPKFGTTAGEWSVLSLLRGMQLGYDYVNHIPADYFDGYISRIEETVSTTLTSNTFLDNIKSTEYSRLMLTLGALSYDATSVGVADAKFDFIEDLSSSFTYEIGRAHV